MSTRRVRGFAAVVLVGALAVAGCGAASGTVAPPTPVHVIRTATDALKAVIAHEPRLDGIRPFDSGLVGQSSSYTIQPASGVGVYLVAVRIGWGDCESGCINEHVFTYSIGPDGTVSTVSEVGPPVPPDAWPTPVGAGMTGITGVATAGPVCPVERVPPDPGCAARPVAGATIIIRDAAGTEVARTVTAADGSYVVELPSGEYRVEPQAVTGLLGLPEGRVIEISDGTLTTLDLEYDTGIR